MWLIESFKKRKLILLNIFLTLYVGINLIGGERGLVSYFEKKTIHQELIQQEIVLNEKLQDLKHKIKLIKKTFLLIRVITNIKLLLNILVMKRLKNRL